MNYRCNLRGFAFPIVMACLGLSGGCVEPNYRADVRPTGQGGVEVHRIPKDDPAPASVAPPSSPAPAATPTPQAVDERIEELEKQVRAQNEEIQKLKQEKAVNPTTAQ